MQYQQKIQLFSTMLNEILISEKFIIGKTVYYLNLYLYVKVGYPKILFSLYQSELISSILLF